MTAGSMSAGGRVWLHRNDRFTTKGPDPAPKFQPRERPELGHCAGWSILWEADLLRERPFMVCIAGGQLTHSGRYLLVLSA